jgi:hypothetical protein
VEGVASLGDSHSLIFQPVLGLQRP